MPVRNFEPINPATDITNTRTFLHEVIPITGSIVSGTYADENIKNYNLQLNYLLDLGEKFLTFS